MNSQPLEPTFDVSVDSIVVTPLVNDVAVPDFDATYVREFGGLVRLAVLLVDDVNRAEEVVQDAFIKSHRRWHRIDNHRAYLRSAVLNGCRSELRRRRLWRRSVSQLVTPSSSMDSPDEVFDIIRKLPRKQREVLVMRYWLDWPEAQIAETLSIAPGTVKSTLSRALDQLRKELS
jgi:RNA polymerase sigma-70 factor (sigma-E family)